MNLKNFANKQNRNRIIDKEITWRVIIGEGEGENGEEGSGTKKQKW